MSNFLHIKNIDFPGVILDILLGSMELGVELVMRITEDLKIISEIKSLHIARLGSIEARFCKMFFFFQKKILDLILTSFSGWSVWSESTICTSCESGSKDWSGISSEKPGHCDRTSEEDFERTFDQVCPGRPHCPPTVRDNCRPILLSINSFVRNYFD